MRRWFLDLDSVYRSVFSRLVFDTLFNLGDDIQHGNIGKIGDFLATFITTQPSNIHFTLDKQKRSGEIGACCVDHEYAVCRPSLSSR